MAKILLTSIGTGRYDRNSDIKSYSKARYQDPDSGEFLETAYIYEALLRFRGIEKIVFIGTAGSNWFLLYEHLFDKESVVRPMVEKDDSVSVSLLELLEAKGHADMEPSEVRRILEPLKKALGYICMDIVVLKYGLTEEEITFNIQSLAALSDRIQNRDSLSFDITHSFRSLVFYELLTVNYFRKIGKKDIRIDFVSYGMFEVQQENQDYTPISDQSVFLELMDWTNAAEEYHRFGTTYSLVDLLGKSSLGAALTPKELEVLRGLSDSVAINDIRHFRKLIDRCKELSGSSVQGRFVNPAVRYVFDDIYKRFADATGDMTILMIEFARWHMEKQRYINAAILICESMIKFCRQVTRESYNDFGDALKYGKSHDSLVGSLLHEYNAIRETRNNLCHGLPLKPKEIEDLHMHIRSYASTYCRHFFKNKTNKEALQAFFDAEKGKSYFPERDGQKPHYQPKQ